MSFESQSLLCGKRVAEDIYKELDKKLKPQKKDNYSIDVILVGDKPESNLYVSMKSKKLNEYNIHTNIHHFDEDVTEKELVECIKELNYSNQILGIMIQLPLPQNLNTRRICNTIVPYKDVDGLTTSNIGGILTNTSLYKPCTAESVMKILEYYKVPVHGKYVTILGKSNVIGMSVFLLLSQKNATVSLCDIHTEDPKQFTKNSDIIVSATGKAELLNVTWFSNKSCVIIDVGISVKEIDSKKVIYGDMQKSLVSSVWKKTPVPGGVGPVTIAVLVSHSLKAYHKILDEKMKIEDFSLNIPEAQLRESLHQFC